MLHRFVEQSTRPSLRTVLIAKLVSPLHLHSFFNDKQLERIEKNPKSYKNMPSNAQNIAVNTVVSAIINQVSKNIRTMQDEAQAQTIKEVVETIHNNRDSIFICLSSVMELCTFSFNSGNRAIMTSNGVLKDLCYTLKKFSDDEEFVTHAGCLIASLLFQDDESKEDFRFNHGPQILTQVMNTHLKSVTVQKSVARALRNAVWNSCNNCEKTRHLNTVNTLFELLTLHSNHKDLVEEILACICNIIVMSNDSRWNILITPSYLNQLLSEWQSNITNRKLICMIGLIFVHLTKDEGYPGRTGIKIVVEAYTKIPGPDLLCSSLRYAISVEDETMIATLSKLIYTLAYVEEFKSRACQSLYLQHLIGSLKLATGSIPELLSILHAIEALLSGTDSAKKRFNDLNDLNGSMEVITVMECHKNEDVVIATCCRILDNAADGQLCTTKVLVMDKQLLGKAILTAMADYPKNVLIQEHSCMLLIKIASTHSSAANLLVNLGAKVLVDMARHTHQSQPSIGPLASHLLSLMKKSATSHDRRRCASTSSKTSSRFRSRSRTIDNPCRSRSKGAKNRSPVNMLVMGRRALQAAQNKLHSECSDGDGLRSSAVSEVDGVRPLVDGKRRCGAMKFNLDPVLE